MVNSCCIVGCSERQSKQKRISLHRIPVRPDERYKRWLNAIRRIDKDGQPWMPTSSARVCCLHFVEGKPSEDPSHPDFVPNKNLPGYEHQSASKLPGDRHRRASKRKLQDTTNDSIELGSRFDLEDTAHNLTDLSVSAAETKHPESKTLDDTNIATLKEILCNLSIKEENTSCLSSEYRGLKGELGKSKCTYGNMSEREISFYTGVSPALFDWIFTRVKGHIKSCLEQLSLQDHLLVVLIKIRLGLLDTDLSFRFDVPQSSISIVLKQTIPTIANCLKALIIWPTNDVTLSKAPESLLPDYKRVVSTVDCFEIFIEKPNNSTARVQTWSNYKHQNTIKYLIAITPAGVVNFISKGWGGRVSDKMIILNSGYLENLSHGDEVLADRRFNVSEEFGKNGLTLRILSCTREIKQLSDAEVQSANIRIHVERVIDRIKKFLIICSIIPLTQLHLLDDIMIIAAAISNLLPSLVDINSCFGAT